MRRLWMLSLLLVLAGPSGARANPIPMWTGVYGIATDDTLWWTTAIAALLVEYLAVRRFLRGRVIFRRVVALFLVVHAITFPLTQLLAPLFLFFAELVPLFAEPALYRRSLVKHGILVPGLANRIVAANLASFFFGLLWNYGFLIVFAAMR